jgi:CHAT domain-containing protein/tetratricopeptide (TPR) repeat protein
LAAFYRVQGRDVEATPLLRRALTIWEKARGPNHPDVARSLNNLAVDLVTLAQYGEAEPLHKRALAIREKTFGPENPQVAESLINLAALYDHQGHYGEAEPLYRRALWISEQALGRDHPDVAGSLDNLAAFYREQGRYTEAEPLFKRALDIREKTFGPDHPEVGGALNSLARLYTEQGRYAEADPLLRRAMRIRERVFGPDHPTVAVSLSNLVEIDLAQGRYGEAESALKRALMIVETALGANHPDVAGSLGNLALLYGRQGRYSEAESLNKRALAIFEKVLGPDHRDVAGSLNNLAELYQAQGRNDEAEPLLRRALAINEKALGPDHPDVAVSLSNLAADYEDQNRYAAAEPLLWRALTIFEKAVGPEHPNFATGLNNVAFVYSHQGDYVEAEPLYLHSMAILEKALGRDNFQLVDSLTNLAELRRAQGRIAAALPLSVNVVDIMQKHLAAGATQRSGGAIAERRSDRFYFANYIRIADEASRMAPERRPAIVTNTFRVVQMAQASSVGEAVAALAARIAAGGGPRTAMIRERQDLVQQWQGLDSALVKSVSRVPAARRPAEEVSLRAALKEATQRLDGLDTRIAAEFPNYAELSNSQPLPAEAAQALLASDEALLVYLATDKATWVWVLRCGDLTFHRIEINAKALAGEVKALRRRLDPDLNPKFLPFPATRAYALFQRLVAPAQPLLAGVRHLLIVPDGALQSLPLGVLVTQPPEHDPETPADYRGIAWLARDYAVTVLPSVSSLRGLRQFANSEHAPAPFLGIGNPVLSGRPGGRTPALPSLWRGALADVEAVRELPPLPETAEELRAIARTMGTDDDDLLLADRASEPVLRQIPLDRYRVVAFATHGLMSGELKGLAEPALVLTPPAEATADNDGLLTTSKIATLKFNADWVVLSACNTAAEDGAPDGGGLSGLAKAFFYAGARSLLVSHWPVRSDAAAKLTTGALAELAKHSTIGRAEALRRSMMAMLDPANPPEFAHPQAWAPFVLAGEGGAGR